MKKIIFILLIAICIKVNASIVVMDADSGRVLYSKDMNERKLIASTSKIMTSIIALENSSLNDIVEVGDEIDKVYGSMTYIKKGEKFYIKDLLYGLMLQSGNDAAMTIASKTLGIENFIAQMNIKAYMLGMYNTSFENPHGLNDSTKNYSSAYDMALLMKYAIKNKDFLKITSTKKYMVNNYTWNNKNKLLFDYKYLLSGKIGYTKLSGQVFVSSAYKNGKTIIIVSIDEPDKFNLHKSLYENFFKMYDRYKVLDKNTLSFKVKTNDNDHYYILNDFYMLLKKDEIDDVSIDIILDEHDNYVKVNYENKIIHKEKLYKMNYKDNISRLKHILLFSK